MITLKEVKSSEKVNVLIRKSDDCLEKLGYTEHNFKHAEIVSRRAKNILQVLDHKDEVNAAEIAAYLHDIGNLVNRQDHSQSGALIAFDILKEMKMNFSEIIDVMKIIGNHEENEGGYPVSRAAAAVILADKSDVRRNRVREKKHSKFDKHDRVNYAVLNSDLITYKGLRLISLKLRVDTRFSSIMEYFEIFMDRMLIMKKAAESLGCRFEIFINKTKIL
jgi:metal-dependent HD superfamily phosphatase/phosphodiesterase